MKRVYNSLHQKNVHTMCIAVENVKIIANGIYYKKKNHFITFISQTCTSMRKPVNCILSVNTYIFKYTGCIIATELFIISQLLKIQ